MSGLVDALARLSSPWVYVVVGVLTALEASAFLGLVIPGELALLVGGYLAHTGNARLGLMMLAAAAGAIVGDSIGYEVGRHLGARLRTSRMGLRIGEERWQRVEVHLETKGGRSIFLGRFVSILRALVPAAAGAARMPYRRFLVWNAAGGIVWASGSVLAGYLAGSSYRRVEHYAGRAGALLALVALAIVAVAAGARWIGTHQRQLRQRASAVMARPRIASLRRRYRTQLDFVGRRLTPGGALGLALTVQMVLMVLTGWVFGTILQDVLGRDELAHLDRPVTRYMADHRVSWLTTTMRAITHLGGFTGVMAVVVLGGALLARGSRRRWDWGPLGFLAASLLGGVVLSHSIKTLVGRPRPRIGQTVAHASGFAFPSGHATQATAVWGALAVLVIPRVRSASGKVVIGAGAAIIVLLVGVSRVYLGVHWTTDVLGGWTLGGVWLILLTAVTREVSTRRANRADDRVPLGSDLMDREVVSGYCWPQSVSAGSQVSLHLSSAGARPVRVEVARVGATREVVHRADAVVVGEHETPAGASSRGCGWPSALTVDVDPAWRSGYYEVVLEIDVDGKVRRDYAFFVVRPSAGSRMVLALATNTWHAYNDFGGPNLYTGGTHVSMQRPMAPGYLFKPPGKGRRVTGTGAPDPQNAAHVGYIQLNHLSGYAGSAGWPDWELPFIEWAEGEGFEIGVCTNADLEDHPEVLEGAGLYLSVGHDEYWSRGMRDTVEAFIARGGNAAFFSGNTSLWQVRLEGHDHEVMVGYKGFFKSDPLMDTEREPEVTTFWSDVIVGRPENHMTGVSFTRGGYHRIGRNVTAGLGGYTVHRAGHWLFDGTGLGYGDVLGAGSTVVGYECDGCVFTYRDGLPYPTGEDGTPSTLEILGTCPTQHFTRETAPRPPKPGEPSELEYIASRVFGTREPEAMERIRHGHAVLGAYTNKAGATVVTSGSTDWAHGLAGRDPQIEQVTRNILTRLG